MSGDDIDGVGLENCVKHGTFYAEGTTCCECDLAALRAENERLRGELGLMLEYFERGTPYWYGTSPADRIRAVLDGKTSPVSARIEELKAALRRIVGMAEKQAHSEHCCQILHVAAAALEGKGEENE